MRRALLLSTLLVAPLQANAVTCTWDTTFSVVGAFVYSGGNLIATTQLAANSTFKSIRSTNTQTSGKHYWEVKATAWTSGNEYGIGLGNANMSNATFVGADLHSVGWEPSDGVFLNNVALASGTNYSVGDIIGIAVDVGGGTISFYKNGTLAYSNLNISTLISNNGTLYAAGNSFNTNDVIDARFDSGAWVETPPAGFISWCLTAAPASATFFMVTP